jgi:hypothetical protein
MCQRPDLGCFGLSTDDKENWHARGKYEIVSVAISPFFDRLCGLVADDPEALPDFLRSSGSGMGSTNLVSRNEKLLGRNNTAPV